MTVNKLQKIEGVVEKILEEHPEARDDDYILLYYACQRFNADALNDALCLALLNHYEKMPNWESVTRARRKIQAKRPDLCGNKKKRRKNEEKYREYASL